MSEENDDKPFEASEQKLRRARAVAGNDAPRALLIQDFIIQ